MPDEEWWVLIEPKTDTWMRVTAEEAKHYPVVQCKLTRVITHKMLDDLLDGVIDDSE